jgi:hypothetical protein
MSPSRRRPGAARGIPIDRADCNAWHRQAYRYCGIVADQRLVALAAVWAHAPADWELAVRTRQGFRPLDDGVLVC